MKKNATIVALSLDDLRVESFEPIPELAENITKMVLGGNEEFYSSCYSVCETGTRTVVCYAPSGTESEA